MTVSSRRARVGLPVAAVVLLATAASSAPVHSRAPLHASAVAVGPEGTRTAVGPHDETPWIGGTRVVGDPARARAQLAWLAAGSVPGADGPYAAMTRTALFDLHTLTDGGAVLGAWSKDWRYVWPRDAAFVAAAYARTGHAADARNVLAFLQSVQGADGSFQARYLPDGSGVPDRRGPQEDGPGWALWALAELSRVTTLDGFEPLLARSSARLVARTRDGLPPASSDYWERRERVVTLGIAAPALAGLDAAAYLYDLRGDATAARRARVAADRTAAAIVDGFGPDYPRRLGGREMDAAVTFLLPPFQRRSLPGVRTAARRAVPLLRRPAGGLAPGEGWTDDGLSWTPETALFALTSAATGNGTAARHWLDWLAAHRTPDGALPEKVRYDGRPAGPAPLAWTAALVVLAVSELP